MKQEEVAQMDDKTESLPSWERGLKLRCGYGMDIASQSLPSWERGLKHYKYL